MANRNVQSRFPNTIIPRGLTMWMTAACRVTAGAAILILGPIALGIAQNGPGELERITGGTVPCIDGRAGIFECRNVDLVSFLPVR